MCIRDSDDDDDDNNNNSNNNSRVDDQLTLERETHLLGRSPNLRGKGLDPLTLALPYPSSPALGRKDTTYAWSYRLRSP